MNLGTLRAVSNWNPVAPLFNQARDILFGGVERRNGGAGVARDYTPWIKGYSLQQHAAEMAMPDTEPDEGQ